MSAIVAGAFLGTGLAALVVGTWYARQGRRACDIAHAMRLDTLAMLHAHQRKIDALEVQYSGWAMQGWIVLPDDDEEDDLLIDLADNWRNN